MAAVQPGPVDGGLPASIVRALARAVRATGYYDGTHPVFRQALEDAWHAIQQGITGAESLTLGSCGTHLIIDEEGGILADAPARALAERMFDLSVVAVRLYPDLRIEDLGVLLGILVQSTDRVREAGGARTVLLEGEAHGIDAYEVDFGALFAGAGVDLSPLVEGNPVAELALRSLLMERAGDAEGGTAVAVELNRLTSPESLGAFLDELLNQAEPGVVERSGSSEPVHDTPTGFGLLSQDDLADAAVNAYFVNQRSLAGRDEELIRSAQALNDALVRLSPAGRFALLRKLAGGDIDEGSEENPAVGKFAGRANSSVLVDTIISGLLDSEQDSETVRAVGNLLRRIWPVEAERRRVLQQIDGQIASRGKALDGVLWQELQARALDETSFGMIELNVERHREALMEWASARRRNRVPSFEGQDILHAADSLVVNRRALRALSSIVLDARPLGEGTLEAIRQLVETIDEHGVSEESVWILSCLMGHADHGLTPGAAEIVHELLEGTRGRERTARLIRAEESQGRLMGEVLLRSLDGSMERAARDAVYERLSRFPLETLRELGATANQVPPVRVRSLLRVCFRVDSGLGTRVARLGLRNPNGKAKEVALRVLGEIGNNEAIALLAGVAGWKGERAARGLLGLPATGGPGARFHELHLLAVSALGSSRSSLAVGPLKELLLRERLLRNREAEAVRQAAAEALQVNETEDAAAVLAEGLQHKRKYVREACERAVGGRIGRRR